MAPIVRSVARNWHFYTGLNVNNNIVRWYSGHETKSVSDKLEKLKTQKMLLSYLNLFLGFIIGFSGSDVAFIQYKGKNSDLS